MDARQYAPATQRNREPILKILSEVIPANSNILEVASGTGEHAIFFAERLESCRWIPSDLNSGAYHSIKSWKDTCPADNLESPLLIDVAQDNWQQQIGNRKINAIVNINMIHIAPWQACLSLFKGAEEILSPGGILYLYGPYKRNGDHTAPSNASFDRSLRDRNSLWGIRDLEAVVATAEAHGLKLQQVVAMPANNLSVIFLSLNYSLIDQAHFYNDQNFVSRRSTPNVRKYQVDSKKRVRNGNRRYGDRWQKCDRANN